MERSPICRVPRLPLPDISPGGGGGGGKQAVTHPDALHGEAGTAVEVVQGLQGHATGVDNI